MDTVCSADGTTIAFDRTGTGRALVLVVGAFGDRHTTRSLTKVLATGFTVYEYDRRGRGASGDGGPYTVEREVEDLGAVVAVTGGPPFVFGHSSGAVLALEAAVRGVRMSKLAVYEPPYIVDETRERPRPDLADRLTALVAAGRRGDAAKLFLTEAVQVSPGVMATIENGPAWPGMMAIAHTLSYDVAVCNNNELRPDRLATILVPTLVLGGGNSPEWFHNTVRAVAAAIPNAQLQFLDGQDHGAADDVLAPVLVGFARDPAPEHVGGAG
jgi:pimeloyl-ACP methyl ester carboxylesterase